MVFAQSSFFLFLLLCILLQDSRAPCLPMRQQIEQPSTDADAICLCKTKADSTSSEVIQIEVRVAAVAAALHDR